MQQGSILVVDDDRRFGHSLGRALAADGHRVEVFEEPSPALAELEREVYDLVFTDLVMPEMDGLELIGRAKRIRPSCEVVLITGHPTFESVRSALRQGARDYLTKPASFEEEVRPLVDSILDAPPASTPASSAPDGAFPGVADPGGPMGAVVDLLPRVARSRAPVLVVGESGTGKELVAEAIHRMSDRSGGPFVQVNCAALHDGLLEAELFGAVRGAYTGATRGRPGFFEVADGGTLFLDEIAETTPSVQAKLLRVIQHGAFHRLGDPAHAVTSNARVVAATNRDLEREVHDGRFRLDLFYRLGVLPIPLPPLRERMAELPALIEHCARELGQPGAVVVEPAALHAMHRHDWPGNVRELRNAVEHAFVLGGDGVVRLEHLPRALRMGESQREPGGLESLRGAELRQIRQALQQTRGNRSQAARLLGITRRALGYRIRKHGLEEEVAALEHRPQPFLPGFEPPPST